MPRTPHINWQSLAEQAMAHRRRGDHAAAIVAYRAALALPGAPAELHFNLGNALCQQGSWAEAEAPLAQALAANPALTVAALQLARCRARLGRYEAAAAGFAAVLRGEPGNFNAALEGGHALRRLGREAEALGCYAMAIRAAPARWEGHLATARALEEGGRADEGAAHYHQALALAGDDRPRRLHLHMTQYRLERGAAALALESLRQAMLCAALEQPPPGAVERARMQLDLAAILLRLGLGEEAERRLGEATEIAEDEAILVQAADLALRHNLWQQGLAILRRNVALRDLVSQVLTFDYLGALAVSLLFPLVLAPHLGLVRTGFLFGMLNVGVGLWTLYAFRFELANLGGRVLRADDLQRTRKI
jgi:tetratricopeptide (TPR) repeat protein